MGGGGGRRGGQRARNGMCEEGCAKHGSEGWEVDGRGQREQICEDCIIPWLRIVSK